MQRSPVTAAAARTAAAAAPRPLGPCACASSSGRPPRSAWLRNGAVVPGRAPAPESGGDGRAAAVAASPARRALLSTALALALSPAAPPPAARAAAELTLADVTPPVAPAGPLAPREAALVDVYERTLPSVVNVFDVTLQARPPPLSL